MDILKNIKKAKLVGMGGACFPTYLKWEMVKKAPGKIKYIICNCAEGEPDVGKDGYIIEKYPEQLIRGIEIAIEYLQAKKAYIYINYEYNRKFGKKLKSLITNSKIEIFVKPKNYGYIAGEESAVINIIEGKRREPRLRPPFPVEKGLFCCPTLVNNVETLYNVSLVDAGTYSNERFYTISGECKNKGVFRLPSNWSIEKILKHTNNYPKFDFFVQIGGGAAGTILNSKQLRKRVDGAGSIKIFNRKEHKPEKLFKKWLSFFVNNSCGKCTACREGTYRLLEILNSKDRDWKLFLSLIDNLEETSFCGLGSALPGPIKSYLKNINRFYEKD